MTNSKSLSWILALGALGYLAHAWAAPAGTAEQAVTAAEHQWAKGQRTNNIDLIAPLLADKVVVTTEDGTVLDGKTAVLGDAKATTWSSAEEKDLKVTVFDRTAIATGTFVGEGRDGTGKPVHAHVRFTDTWVNTGGAWLCVAGHDSPTKM